MTATRPAPGGPMSQLCDCHSNEMSAKVRPDGKLLLQDRRHGETHYLLLDRIPKNTVDMTRLTQMGPNTPERRK